MNQAKETLGQVGASLGQEATNLVHSTQNAIAHPSIKLVDDGTMTIIKEHAPAVQQSIQEAGASFHAHVNPVVDSAFKQTDAALNSAGSTVSSTGSTIMNFLKEQWQGTLRNLTTHRDNFMPALKGYLEPAKPLWEPIAKFFHRAFYGVQG